MSAPATLSGDDDSQYRIEATGGFREPRSRILKHGDTFAVFNPFGDIAGGSGSPDGLYHDDTRHLSQLELYLNGDRPLLLSANPGEDNALLTVDLANPDTQDAGGGALHRELIYLNRRQFVWQGAYNELLLVRNFDRDPHVVTISLRCAADFADVFEVRGQRRASGLPTRCCASARFPAGASAPWRCRRRATTRSRITTGRSGRMTMR